MRTASVICFWVNLAGMLYMMWQFGISEDMYYAVWAAFLGAGAIIGAIAIPWLD